MKKASGLVSSFLVLLSILLSLNCATLTRSRTQRIPVTSSPIGATVSVNGQQQGVTPLEIRLVRKKKGQVIRIESPGYNPVEIQVKRKMSVLHILGDVYWGSGFAFSSYLIAVAYDIDKGGATAISLAWFAVPILIDMPSGKKYTVKPKEVTVTLTKADGPPRVDTILIDADDLQNVKWIRVRRD